ncbi:hypothetical protein [Ramlibacter sp.]|uniref:hypothetical protein n=1 Tax=Ramlibacter sp. TaxID=1917967 RepID=UPI002C7F9325|nr:hypothetical protein [Ramlibacter sp.]HWI81714.1 hypothetical protein [Ramlibacter sp.]
MTKLSCRALFPVAAVALLLSACGGGGGDGDFKNEPRASTRPASVTVANSADTTLNGGYATNDVFLNDIVKVNPIGGEPETCRMRFANLPKTGASLVMDGEIRYKPGTTETTVTIVSINTIEFQLAGPAGANVNRAGNVVTYTNAVFQSTQGTGRSITLSGTIPLRAENKPEGC